MTPHRCPLCDGEGRRLRLWADATGPLAVKCEPCGGTGIVWEPEAAPTVTVVSPFHGQPATTGDLGSGHVATPVQGSGGFYSDSIQRPPGL